jgi:hypothetical protein
MTFPKVGKRLSKTDPMDFGRMAIIDNGKQTGACRQYCVDWIFQTPTLVKFWNRPGLEIEGKQVGELLNTKRAGSNCNELKQAMGIFPFGLIDDVSQRTLVCLVKSLG